MVLALIQWTQHTPAAFIQYMGINHDCKDIAMPQQFMHCADVINPLFFGQFNQVARFAVAQAF
jgi:hypothetical protein